LVKSAFEFGRGDGHRFEHAEHIGEPESDEAHVAFLDGPQHVFLLFVHSLLLVSSAVCSPAWCSPVWCSRAWCSRASCSPASLSPASFSPASFSPASCSPRWRSPASCSGRGPRPKEPDPSCQHPAALGRDLLSGPATDGAPAAGPVVRGFYRRRPVRATPPAVRAPRHRPPSARSG